MPRRWRVRPEWDGDDGWRRAVYYAVCESYRDQSGIPRHRTVENLGPAGSPGELAEKAQQEAEDARRHAVDAEKAAASLDASLRRREARQDPEIELELPWDALTLEEWRRASRAWNAVADGHLERALALETLHQRTVDPSWRLPTERREAT